MPGFVSWVLGIVCWVLGFVSWVLGIVFGCLDLSFGCLANPISNTESELLSIFSIFPNIWPLARPNIARKKAVNRSAASAARPVVAAVSSVQLDGALEIQSSWNA